MRGGASRVIHARSIDDDVINVMHLSEEQYKEMVQGVNKINEDNIHKFVMDNIALNINLDMDDRKAIFLRDDDVIIATYGMSNTYTPASSRSKSSTRSKSPSRRGGSKKRRKSKKRKP